MSKDNDERIDEIEISLMHQERTINEMSDMIRQQWVAIECLKRELSRLEAIKADIEPNEEADAPPLHY